MALVEMVVNDPKMIHEKFQAMGGDTTTQYELFDIYNRNLLPYIRKRVESDRQSLQARSGEYRSEGCDQAFPSLPTTG